MLPGHICYFLYECLHARMWDPWECIRFLEAGVVSCPEWVLGTELGSLAGVARAVSSLFSPLPSTSCLDPDWDVHIANKLLQSGLCAMTLTPLFSGPGGFLVNEVCSSCWVRMVSDPGLAASLEASLTFPLLLILMFPPLMPSVVT